MFGTQIFCNRYIATSPLLENWLFVEWQFVNFAGQADPRFFFERFFESSAICEGLVGCKNIFIIICKTLLRNGEWFSKRDIFQLFVIKRTNFCPFRQNFLEPA